MSTTKQTVVALWHYQCPECGISDQETAYHGQTHMIYCEVCLEDNQHVRLKRWQVDPESGALAPGRLDRG